MKKQTLKETRGRGETARTILTGAKLNEAERERVDGFAARFAAGSVAKWARVAMLNYRPKKEDFE